MLSFGAAMTSLRPMAKLAEMVAFLDRELGISTIPDYPGAMNGLQLENEGTVDRVIAAVDASLPVIEKAAAGGPGLLVVHHGMFWQGAQPVTGSFRQKLKIALDANLAVYSCHLPLDVHPELGNNMGLARAIGLRDPEPFFEEKGLKIGVRGSWSGTREDLGQILRDVLDGDVRVCPAGRKSIRSLGIITGGAGSEVAKVAAAGVDAFVTGEGPHWSFVLAEELGINVFYGGHYATETFGVQSVGELLAERFQCPWTFINHPSGF
jgi:dinuclear metal center YbgI/SA1388 family protein